MIAAALPPHQQTIEEAVTIRRPPAEVFSYYRDLRNLPHFLGDVMGVDRVDPVTYRWTIAGPFGTRLHWTVRVTDDRPNEIIGYETVTGSAWKTRWQVHFAPGSRPGETRVREVMEMPFGSLGRMALAAIGKFPAGELRSNLHRLKQVLETGIARDESYAVAGKFAGDPISREEKHRRRR